MSTALEQMYQQVILDHAKFPHGKGLDPSHEQFDGCWGQSHQLNPTCGDEITMRTVVDSASTVTSVTWDGHGCSISQASASVLTQLVVGSHVDQATHLGELFRQLMGSRGQGLDSEEEMDELADATAFTGVSQFPARIKCALLGWVAFQDAVARSGFSSQRIDHVS